jgi:phage FluMu protein Com
MMNSVKCALCGKVFQQDSRINNSICPKCHNAIEFIHDNFNQIRAWSNSKPEPIAETLAEIEAFAISGMEFIESFSEVFSDE